MQAGKKICTAHNFLSQWKDQGLRWSVRAFGGWFLQNTYFQTNLSKLYCQIISDLPPRTAGFLILLIIYNASPQLWIFVDTPVGRMCVILLLMFVCHTETHKLNHTDLDATPILHHMPRWLVIELTTNHPSFAKFHSASRRGPSFSLFIVLISIS